MSIKICLRHQKVNDGSGWKHPPSFRNYMLWVKQPCPVEKCDSCFIENNLNETMRLLRNQEE